MSELLYCSLIVGVGVALIEFLANIATIVGFLEKHPNLISYIKRIFVNLLAVAKKKLLVDSTVLHPNSAFIAVLKIYEAFSHWFSKNISSIKLPDGSLHVPAQRHILQLGGSLRVAVLKQVA